MLNVVRVKETTKAVVSVVLSLCVVVDPRVSKVCTVLDVRRLIDDCVWIERANKSLVSRKSVGTVRVNSVTTTCTASLKTTK